MTKWNRVDRMAARGQRFFVKEDNAHRAFLAGSQTIALYVCDNSGCNPDETDDGPLRLDRDYPVTISHSRSLRKLVASAKVTAQGMAHDTDRYTVGLTLEEAAWLVSKGFRVEITMNSREEMEAASKLWAAHTLPASLPL